MATLALALFAGASVGATPASAWFLSPDSPNTSGAESTHVLYWIGLVVAVALAVAINAALLKALKQRKPAPDRISTATAPARAQFTAGGALTGLFVVLLALGIIFTEKSNDVAASQSGADRIEIDATGQQWLWRYDYPNEAYSYYRLTIPVDTPITLDVMTTDVVHSWHVPSFGGAVDAVPGKSHRVSFVADEEGIYEGRSGVFSGQGYAAMRTEVAVVSQEEYDQFLDRRLEETKQAQEEAMRSYRERQDEE